MPGADSAAPGRDRSQPQPAVVRTRRLSLCVAGFLLVGCTAYSSAGPDTSADGSAPVSPVSSTCSPIELRTPGGSRVDLTGTWRGRSAVHYVRQSGSCVWWIALSDIPGEPAGSAHSITFHGQIRQDFTLVGEWAFVVRPIMPGTPPSAMEPVTFSIEVDGVGGQEAVIIQGPGAGPNTGGPVADFYAAITLERVGPLPVSR